MRAVIKRFLSDEQGATAIEYGLIAVLISMVVISAATNVFNAIGVKFNIISNNLH